MHFQLKLIVYNNISEIFQILQYETNCILIGQPFKITISPVDNLNLSFSVFLKNENISLELKNKNDNNIYEVIPSLEGNYSLEIYDNNYNNRIYFISNIYFTSFTVEKTYFYKDWIILNNLYCTLNKLGILPLSISDAHIIPLICNKPYYSNDSIICKVSSYISYYDSYSIYYENYNTNQTIYISNTLSQTNFIITQPNSSSLINTGYISITIQNTKNDFYMPFLSHVLIKSDRKDTLDQEIQLNLSPDKIFFTFKIYVKEKNTYTFYLFRKSIPYQDENNEFIKLNRIINVNDSPFEINNDIEIINKGIRNQNVSFELNLKQNSNQIDLKKIIIDNTPNNNKCLIKSNSIILCYYILKNTEASIIPITYSYWTKYFYIFSYEVTSSICKTKNSGSLFFKLETPKFYNKTINIGNFECENYIESSFNIFTCFINVKNNMINSIKITSGNFKKEINLQSNIIFTNITSITGKLIEGSSFQLVKVIFQNELLEDELIECNIIKGNNILISSIPILSSNNKRKISLIFNLNNIIFGTYILQCENKCGEKTSEKEIDILRIKCTPPLIRYIDDNYPSCKYCQEMPNNKIYYQEGECVEKCDDNLNYAISPKEGNKCIFCYETELKNNLEYCVENCAKGTIEYDGQCYLPEDLDIEIIKNLGINVCNYLCVKDHYISCDINLMKCNCKVGYIGLFCEFDFDLESIIKPMKAINKYTLGNDDFDYSNNNLVSQIKGVLFLVQMFSNLIPKNIASEFITYFKYSDSSLESMEYNSKINVFYFNQLSLFLNLFYNNLNDNRRRRLKMENDYIKKILLNAHYINKKGAMESNLPKNGYKIFSDELNLISYIWYKKFAINTIIDHLKYYYNSSLSIINLTDCLEDEDVVILTIIPNNLMFYIDNIYNESIIGVNLFISLNNSNIDLLSKCKFIDYSIFISSSLLKFNNTLYHFYMEKGINIYDKNETIFNELCFKSDDFDYDLPFNYRRNKIYQDLSYNNQYCKFSSINNKTVIFNCSGDQKDNIILIGKKDPFDNKKIKYIPFKCRKYIKDPLKNMAFILSIILITLFIISIFLSLCVGCRNNNERENIKSNPPRASQKNSNSFNLSDEFQEDSEDDLKNKSPIKSYDLKSSKKKDFQLKNSLSEGCVSNYNKENENNKISPPKNEPRFINYDQDIKKLIEIYNNTPIEISTIHNSIINNNVIHNNNLELEPSIIISETKEEEDENKEENSGKDISDFKNRILLTSNSNFCQILLNNLLILHPLINLFYYPIIHPIFMTYIIFIFNISCVFGLNSFLLNEERIEKRIYDNERNNILYPFKNDKTIIIFNLILTIFFKLLIKIIILTPYNENNNSERKENCSNRNFLCYILMLLSIFLFMTYSVFWCDIYHKSQKFWIYMGLWCLIINWIIFAPIFILFISIFEKIFGGNKCIYYFKILFFF